jgi:hypothetical protein
MRQLALFASLLISFSGHAITYEVIGPCSETPASSGVYNMQDFSVNVGKVSVNIFDINNIAYNGSEAGFSSILGTPTGTDSIEVISDSKMRAYGWCFSVNGISPDLMGSEYFFTANEDKLVWFYAYSTYDSGKWIDYCVPSYKIKAAQFCANK